MEGKNCTKCGEWKVLSDYHVQRAGRFGRKAACRRCTAAANAEARRTPSVAARRAVTQREWRAKNREHVNAEQRRRYAADAPNRRQYHREWKRDNAGSVNATNSRWRSANPEAQRAISRRRIEGLSDAYIANDIYGVPVAALTPELIEAKRIQLKIHRYLKENDSGN